MSSQGVLVVEDDEDTREVLSDLLQDAGYTVFVAPDGKPALERMRAHPEGLVVLMDLMMPGMDGYAVLQELAADSPLAAKHVFFLMTAAGKTLPGKVWQLLKHLNVGLIYKPFDVDEMLHLVEQAANRLPQ